MTSSCLHSHWSNMTNYHQLDFMNMQNPPASPDTLPQPARKQLSKAASIVRVGKQAKWTYGTICTGLSSFTSPMSFDL